MSGISNLTGSFQPLPTGNFLKCSWHLKDYPLSCYENQIPTSLSEARLTPDNTIGNTYFNFLPKKVASKVSSKHNENLEQPKSEKKIPAKHLQKFLQEQILFFEEVQNYSGITKCYHE